MESIENVFYCEEAIAMKMKLVEKTVNGGHFIVMSGEKIPEVPVIWYRLADKASAKNNMQLAEGLIEAYRRYLNNIHNPFSMSKKQGLKEIPHIEDFVEEYGMANLYAVGNGIQIASIVLHSAATSAINNNLVEEVKNVYAKYAAGIKVI